MVDLCTYASFKTCKIYCVCAIINGKQVMAYFSVYLTTNLCCYFQILIGFFSNSEVLKKLHALRSEVEGIDVQRLKYSICLLLLYN